MLSEVIKKKKQHKIEEQNIKLIINRLLLVLHVVCSKVAHFINCVHGSDNEW